MEGRESAGRGNVPATGHDKPALPKGYRRDGAHASPCLRQVVAGPART